MSQLRKKIHHYIDSAHDSIWDAQAWVWSTINYSFQKVRDAHIRGKNLKAFGLYFQLFGAALLSGLVTPVAIAASLTLDILKLGSYAVDKLIEGATALCKKGFSFVKSLFSKKAPVPEQTQLIQAQPLPGYEAWAALLNYARWSPSPHNMQSWLFRVDSEDQVTLMYDPKRLLPDTNPTGSYMNVGFGMLIETLSIACGIFAGPRKDVEAHFPEGGIQLDAKAQGPQMLCTLKLVNRQPSPENYFKETVNALHPELIAHRSTSRLPYNGQEVDEATRRELYLVAKQYNHHFQYTSTPADVNWVVGLNAEAMLNDMSHKRTRNEVGSWIRLSKAEAVKKADGLAAYAMNSAPWKLWLLTNLSWTLRIPGVYRWAKNTYQQTMNGTATVAWLSGPFATFNEQITAGRMMQRWWLTMTKRGYNLHPFGSVITNEAGFKEMNKRFKVESPDQRPLWMLARIGKNHNEEKTPQAQRRPLQDMIIGGADKLGFFAQANQAPVGEAKESKQELSKQDYNQYQLMP